MFTNGLQCTIFFRDMKEAVHSQISLLRNESFFTVPSTFSSVRNHLKNSVLGTFHLPKVEEIISGCPNFYLICKETYEDGEKPFVGPLQMYCNKSRTSLKYTLETVHPIYGPLLAFGKSWKRDHILLGTFILDHFPVSLKESTLNLPRSCIKYRPCTEAKQLQAFLEPVKFIWG